MSFVMFVCIVMVIVMRRVIIIMIIYCVVIVLVLFNKCQFTIIQTGVNKFVLQNVNKTTNRQRCRNIKLINIMLLLIIKNEILKLAHRKYE